MLTNIMRTSLYFPGNHARFIERAPFSGADIVTFDVEDAVPLSEGDRPSNDRRQPEESCRGRRRVYVRVAAGIPSGPMTIWKPLSAPV